MALRAILRNIKETFKRLKTLKVLMQTINFAVSNLHQL